MEIVHICLAASYVEGFGYQENILSQFHAEMGHKVTVLTSDKVFNSKHEKIKREKSDYINDFGIRVKTLKRDENLRKGRFGVFDHLYEELEKIKPEIIFVHGGQFYSLKDIVVYCKKHMGVSLFIDQHADYYNTPVNTFKTKLTQRYVYGHWMRKAIPYAKKYWGVTPWRCQYMKEVYGIPEDKIDLLVMGGDDRYIHYDKRLELRTSIRERLNINEDDFVVISGGKIDKTKNIHRLMRAVIKMDKPDIKLIVFGQPNDDMQKEIKELSEDSHIRNIGWIDSTKVYDYFLASDLVVFPGTHSVLWEQACACGLPGIFKRWDGMQHVNVNGSALFIESDSEDEIGGRILSLYADKSKYLRMKEAAVKDAMAVFSYKLIAKKAIGENVTLVKEPRS